MATTETDQLKDTIELMEIDVTFHKERAERFQAELDKAVDLVEFEQRQSSEWMHKYEGECFSKDAVVADIAALKAVIGQVKEWKRTYCPGECVCDPEAAAMDMIHPGCHSCLGGWSLLASILSDAIVNGGE